MEKFAKTLGLVALVGSMYLVVLAVLWLSQSSLGQPVATAVTSLFAVNSVQAWWYLTRAAGLKHPCPPLALMGWGHGDLPPDRLAAVARNEIYDFHALLAFLRDWVLSCCM